MKPAIVSFVLLFLMTASSFAQYKHRKNEEAEGKMYAAGNEEIVQVLDNFRKAIIKNNQEKISELLTDNTRIL